MTTAEALQRCALFKDFTDTGINILASIAQERALPAGAMLFAESMVGDSFFVVKSGRIRVSVKLPDGRDQTLASLAEGESLGELSLVSSDSLRLVTAHAESALVVVEIRHRDFVKLQAQKPQACLKLILAIAQQFGRKMNDNRDALRTLLVGALRR